MMTKQKTTELDLQVLTPILIRQIIIWGPIVVGLVHQFLMYFFGIESIYVFVDPPGYIEPQISLGYQWWVALLLGSAMVCLIAYSNRFPSVPNRIAIPLYIYILFLLILIKPV